MSKRIEQIKNCQNAMNKMAEHINVLAKKEFFKGKQVSFVKGHGHIKAEVTDFSPGHGTLEPRIRIINLNTGIEYWLDLYWLIRGK